MSLLETAPTVEPDIGVKTTERYTAWFDGLSVEQRYLTCVAPTRLKQPNNFIYTVTDEQLALYATKLELRAQAREFQDEC